MKLICEYEDWNVYENNDKHYLVHGEGVFELQLMKSIQPEEYENKDIFEILEMFDDYDYSGELDDLSAYCFWKIIN